MGGARDLRFSDLVWSHFSRPRFGRFEERVAAVVAGVATFAVFMVGFWGIGGIFPDGHFASQANVGVIGLNMSRYHTVYAYWPFLENPPSLREAYLHHPMGLFWDAALALKIFGTHNWALRLPAVVIVTLTAFFLYRTGRAIWGPMRARDTSLRRTPNSLRPR